MQMDQATDVVTKCQNISPNFMIVICRLRRNCEEMLALGARTSINQHDMNRQVLLA